MKNIKKTVENCCETKKKLVESCCSKHQYHHKCHCHKNGDSGAIYGLGVIGSLFYFLSSASGFSAVLIGIAKSIFWPAVLIFRIFTDLKL